MGRRALFRIAGALVGITCATVGTAAPAGIVPPRAAPTSAPRSHGFMLYFSQPLGGGGGVMRPMFGLRIEQVRMTGNTGAPDGGDPLQHHALIGWQVEGRRDMRVSDMRVEFGSHLTYDVTRGVFGPQVSRSIMFAVQPAWVARGTTQGFQPMALAGQQKFAAERDVIARAIARFGSMTSAPVTPR